MRLFIRHQYDEDRRSFLAARLETAWEVISPADVAGDEAAGINGADAVVSMNWGGGLPAPAGLRLIQLPGAGFESVDFEAVPPGAVVCNVYEHEIGISEFVVLALLEWGIRLDRMNSELHQGRWSAGFVHGCPLHGELFGKTVGFVGYGHIARATAARLRAFDVRTMARTRSPGRSDGNVDDIGPVSDLHTMLSASDFVVVTCPLSDETRGLIDAPALAAMGPHAVLVNVARGEVVDEDALYEACRSGRLGGAVIDTWYRYPTKDEPVRMPSRHPFQDLDNVIMTPHASGWSSGLIDRRWAVIAANLDALARGEPLANLIKAAGAPPPPP